MEQTEKLKEQLRQQEKLASLGTLSAGIAHEVQNPLNFVINFGKMSDHLLRDLTDILKDNANKLPQSDLEECEDIISDLKENMGKIVEHGERAVCIIQSILQVSRGKDNELLPTDVCKLVKEYVWLSYHAMRANCKGFNISIHEQYEEGLPLMMVVPQDLSRAVLNVMNNACYAVWKKSHTAGSDYHPSISANVRAEGTQLLISISDNGVGMTDEVKLHLFDNFFTTKPIGEGTGLGLGITRDIIEKHGGTITFASDEGTGTTFTFTIPIRK